MLDDSDEERERGDREGGRGGGGIRDRPEFPVGGDWTGEGQTAKL